MCGIFASNDPRVKDKHLDMINSRLAFRGPDGQSELISCGDWKLYHSRLSIIAPVDEFSQPHTSSNGSILVFNGEILNFHELLSKYNLPDSESDTAALNELLQLDNFNLKDIEGFFAFIRIDKAGRLTHCARDRFGVKPLFIHKAGSSITVASEASIISDLFELPYSKLSLEEYRAFRSPVFQGSYFEGIESIIPGTCLKGGIYFEPLNEFNKDYLSHEEIMPELEGTIEKAIKSRLVSDVPVGLLFSGGIDSNLLNVISEIQLQRFTGGFAGDYDIESARDNNVGTTQNKTNIVEVSDEDFKKRFFDMVKLRKEPLSVPNEIILSFLAETWANLGGKVLISGEAADEFFGGYDRIFKWAAEEEDFSVDKFLEYYCYAPLTDISETLHSKVEDFFLPLADLGAFEMVRYFFIKKHLPILFRRLDFALMFSGVEGREPLASYNMFKIALKYGPKDPFRGKLGKLPLRLLAEEKISTEFAFTSKVGFPVDLGRIFHGASSKDKFDNYSIWYNKNLEAIL